MRKSDRSAGPVSVSRVLGAILLCWMCWSAAQAQTRPLPSQVELHGGQVAVFTAERAIDRVAIGDGDLLQVTTVDNRQLVLIAHVGGSGYTALHVWFEDGSERTVDVQVNPTHTPGYADAIRKILGPDSSVEVQEISGQLVVSGELNVQDAERVAALKAIYPGIVDLSHADPVGMRPMVRMDVRIMEFRRSGLDRLGIEWDSVIPGPIGALVTDIQGSLFRLVPEGGPFDADGVLPSTPIRRPETYFGLATSIGSQINLLTSAGQAWELANPQLSARSGGSATFLVGGRIPVPIVSELGQTAVHFEEYGIKLEISPAVNSSNQILASVYTEVSKLDPNIIVGGIPGFTTRETATEINVMDGDTIVISGLVDMEGWESSSGIPGLSRLPILGRLFRSDEFRSGRTDLVIFVTPTIVHAGSPANLADIDKSNQMLESFRASIKADIFD